MHHEIQADHRRWARFFPLAKETECIQHMRKTMDSIPGARCILLSTLDGLQLLGIRAAGCDMKGSRLAAITGSMCGLGETLGKELGQTHFQDVLISTETGVAVVQRLPSPGNRMVLLTAASHEANVGIVSTHARYCAQRLAEAAFIAG